MYLDCKSNFMNLLAPLSFGKQVHRGLRTVGVWSFPASSREFSGRHNSKAFICGENRAHSWLLLLRREGRLHIFSNGNIHLDIWQCGSFLRDKGLHAVGLIGDTRSWLKKEKKKYYALKRDKRKGLYRFRVCPVSTRVFSTVLSSRYGFRSSLFSSSSDAFFFFTLKNKMRLLLALSTLHVVIKHLIHF